MTLSSGADTVALDPVVLQHLVGEVKFDPASLQTRYELERERRLRPDGAAQYAPTTAGRSFSSFATDPFADPAFRREPIHDHSEVIIMGGGFAGLLAGAKLRQAGYDDIRLIDAAADVGGTWYWHRYPGAMCDIEAHVYMPLLEEMDYAPKNRYAFADELYEYSRAIAERYSLYQKACFQTRVSSARWVEAERRWLITTDRDDRLTCDRLVLAAGRQSLPKLPRIPGIGDFEGHLFHSSRWDYAYTLGDVHGGMTGLADKRIAVVGTGATALQIVPALARAAQQLVVLQRTPSAVGPRDNCATPRDWVDRSKPGWQKRRMVNFQSLLAGHRLDLDEVDDGWTQYTRSIEGPDPREVEHALGRPLSEAEVRTVARLNDFKLMEQVRARIDDIVSDAETAEALKPWYRWRCKRPGWHDDYLPAFNRPNVTLVDTHGRGVERFTNRGVVANGTEYEVDCVIFATGFEVTRAYPQLLGFDPVGRNGLQLSEHWASAARTWFGVMTDEFPNLFFIGANEQTTSGHNAMHLLDELSEHVAHILSAARGVGAPVLEPAAVAVDTYVHLLRGSDGGRALLDFYGECTPGYFNAEGAASRPEDLFAGGRFADPLEYYRLLKAWRDQGTLEELIPDHGSSS